LEKNKDINSKKKGELSVIDSEFDKELDDYMGNSQMDIKTKNQQI